MGFRWITFVLAACGSTLILGADPNCQNGIPHPNKSDLSCCAATCGDVCGAANCATLGAENCCGYAINVSGRSCNTNDAPCIRGGADAQPAAADRSCAALGGISSSDGKICCPASCVECGGYGCGARPGGGNSCCQGSIETSGKSCATNNPPCIQSGTAVDVPAAANVGPTAPATRSCASLGGILGSDGQTCCAGSCGQCGGYGCGDRPGGANSCCQGSIQTSGKSCNNNNPPCMQTGGNAVEVDVSGNINPIAPVTRSCVSLGGILGSDGQTCCAGSCGQCGGYGCGDRPGGINSCCQGAIQNSGKSCDNNNPPCMQNNGKTAAVVTNTDVGQVGGVKRKVSVGMYTPNYNPVESRETRLGGVKMDAELIYRPIWETNFADVANILNAGRLPTINIEFLDWSQPQLPVINSGKYDWKLREFAQAAAKDGRLFWVRTLHEFNGNWYPWGLFYSNQNSKEQLQLAYQRIIKIFKDAGAWNAKFEISLNVANPNDDPTPFSSFFPYGANYDAVGISCYNRAYVDQWHNFSLPFKTLFQGAYNQLAAITKYSKPIIVSETGTTSYNTDKPAWIRATMADIATSFPLVTQVHWFLEDKDGNWDLHSQAEYDALRDGIRTLKALTS